MKIFLSVILSIVLGLILGYIPSKIAIALDTYVFGLMIAIFNGFLAAKVAGHLADWSRKYGSGVLCAGIISFLAFYNYHYHLYLHVKKNPPQDAPPEIIALKTFKEPQGFFKHLQITAFQEVEYVSRRRGRISLPKFLFLAIEGAGTMFIAIGSQIPPNEE